MLLSYLSNTFTEVLRIVSNISFITFEDDYDFDLELDTRKSHYVNTDSGVFKLRYD